MHRRDRPNTITLLSGTTMPMVRRMAYRVNTSRGVTSPPALPLLELPLLPQLREFPTLTLQLPLPNHLTPANITLRYLLQTHLIQAREEQEDPVDQEEEPVPNRIFSCQLLSSLLTLQLRPLLLLHQQQLLLIKLNLLPPPLLRRLPLSQFYSSLLLRTIILQGSPLTLYLLSSVLHP